jgi:hypothetical protein
LSSNMNEVSYRYYHHPKSSKDEFPEAAKFEAAGTPKPTSCRQSPTRPTGNGSQSFILISGFQMLLDWSREGAVKS